MEEKPQYRIHIGTVQAYISGPNFFEHFGLPEYDSSKPVLNKRQREQAQIIVDKLNAGEMSQEQARIELDKIW